MADQKLPLVLVLAMTMALAGCTSEATPDWGKGEGEIHVDLDEASPESVTYGNATISSKMGTDDYSEEKNLFGCDGSKIKITGILITSTVYPSHDNADGVETAVGASVVIEKMSWNNAMMMEDGTIPRVKIRDWSSPLYPIEDVGNKFADNSDKWVTIGIIPSTENMADGLNVVEEWHQPITLTGYLVDSSKNNYQPDTIDSETCEIIQDVSTGDAMVVTEIRTEIGVVSMSGEHDDEYSLGDTDIFGGVGFIMFFIVVGLGGGLGLYVVSTMIIRQGAKATAAALLGKEGFAKAVAMKSDLKTAKKEGLESASDRAKKSRAQNKSVKKSSKSSKEESAVSGFSLDSVLSQDSDSGPSEFVGGGVTSNSVETQVSEPVNVSQPEIVKSYDQPIVQSSNVVSTQTETTSKRSHFSSAISGSGLSSQPSKGSVPTKGATPVKRRAVKKRAAKKIVEEEVVETQHKAPSVADEDFNDFSL
ncbi:MAG: hypothetical protein QGI21_03650 [Candidatus Poseidoniaceae archaeon]|jgi:hypothetical protein|nr:hypothetical protein [Candidatus Poseidoniaceae archaeon]